MSTQNLIIYKFSSLYHILEEIGLDLNFNIFFANSENSLNEQASNLNNYLVISNRNHLDISNQFILDQLPINIFKLIKKDSKIQFNNQSKVKVNNYIIDLNSKKCQQIIKSLN